MYVIRNTKTGKYLIAGWRRRWQHDPLRATPFRTFAEAAARLGEDEEIRTTAQEPERTDG